MPIYHTDQRKHCLSYGASIGILLLKTRIQFILGDVGNACTFDFPVQYKVVEESSIERLIFNADSTLADPIIKSAMALEQAGVSAITANCGYMALFQKQVSEAVNIPVFLSSLMQIPFINSIMPKNKSVGVVVADSRHITTSLLHSAGVINSNNIFIAGMEKQKNFWSAIMDEQGILDSNAIEKEVVAVASDLRQRTPNIGAILLECSDLPPYSAAVQEALKLPVFDFVTMIKYVFSSVAQNQ